jgi:hypothetical protein
MTNTTAKTSRIRIKSRVKAGLSATGYNHNQMTNGLHVKSQVRAGPN